MSSHEYIAVKDIMLDKNLYRTLTRLSYSDEGTAEHEGQSSLSHLINEMLKEYLHTYILSKRMGHMLLSKDAVKVAINSMTDDQIAEASTVNANRYKEAAVLETGKVSLDAIIDLIRSFAKANKFDIEISKNPDNDNQVLVIGFKLGDKFTQFKANTYRGLLQEYSDFQRMEITGNSVYFEYRPKKEIVQEVK